MGGAKGSTNVYYIISTYWVVPKQFIVRRLKAQL